MGIPYAEVIGDPIAQSKSPVIHGFWLEKLGLEGEYRATRVSAAELPHYLADRRADPDWRGCNVTMPLKKAIRPLLDEKPPGLDTVNCVYPRHGRLIGLNTDIDGVMSATGNWRLPEYPLICLIGAGGAASAAKAAFGEDIGPEFRTIARSRDHAEKPGERRATFSFTEAALAMEGCHGVINASPLGMAGFPAMPDDVLEGLLGLEPGAAVLDMVTAPVETLLLRRAREIGLVTSDGLSMLIGQARTAFHHFFGLLPTSGADAELRKRLAG